MCTNINTFENSKFTIENFEIKYKFSPASGWAVREALSPAPPPTVFGDAASQIMIENYKLLKLNSENDFKSN